MSGEKITLSEASDSLVSIDYATKDQSAKTGEDYIETSGRITFTAGEAKKTINVKLLGSEIRGNNSISLQSSFPIHQVLTFIDSKVKQWAPSLKTNFMGHDIFRKVCFLF